MASLSGAEAVPASLQTILVESANCSLAFHSWRQHRTVLNLISRCQQETGVSLSLPWSQAAYATFVAWCMKRENKSSSISVYESKIRKLHQMNGFAWQAGSAILVRAAIKGRHNTQPKGKARLPITPATLLLLKHKIKEANWGRAKRRLIWAISTTLFVGSFRISEVLAAHSSSHIKGCTLLNENVSEHSEKVAGAERKFLKVRLNNPKEDRNRQGAEVELFELPGLFFDPVHAFRKWRAESELDAKASQPVFRWETGANVTPKEFNSCLKTLLSDSIKYEDGKVTSHSFRAGVTSTMARLGYGEEMIQLQGRWLSQAYLRYCKKGRTNRLEDQYRIFSSLASAAAEANIK